MASGGHTSAGHYAALKDICGASVRPSSLPAVRRTARSAARPRRCAVFGCFAGVSGAPDNHQHLGQALRRHRAVPEWPRIPARPGTSCPDVPPPLTQRNKRAKVSPATLTSVRATTAHETTTTQHVIVMTAATVPTAVRPRYFNYAAPAALSRSRSRIPSANKVRALSSAPLGNTAIAVNPTNPIPMYRYVYETDRILVIDPHTGIAVQAIAR